MSSDHYLTPIFELMFSSIYRYILVVIFSFGNFVVSVAEKPAEEKPAEVKPVKEKKMSKKDLKKLKKHVGVKILYKTEIWFGKRFSIDDVTYM